MVEQLNSSFKNTGENLNIDAQNQEYAAKIQMLEKQKAELERELKKKSKAKQICISIDDLKEMKATALKFFSNKKTGKIVPKVIDESGNKFDIENSGNSKKLSFNIVQDDINDCENSEEWDLTITITLGSGITFLKIFCDLLEYCSENSDYIYQQFANIEQGLGNLTASTIFSSFIASVLIGVIMGGAAIVIEKIVDYLGGKCQDYLKVTLGKSIKVPELLKTILDVIFKISMGVLAGGLGFCVVRTIAAGTALPVIGGIVTILSFGAFLITYSIPSE
ncbi:hypothetical protein FGO68_gene3575 [Halteria grandinella]|uniref:Uncharacterized protein n=1 Tax=Halteria grandinella TaxID=5974 RepID=A0A8J8NKQ0_HALGN|nr:hypothetical protein FGO68_gene3575 [Halteria grandinella]